jgi:hypothetical protein
MYKLLLVLLITLHTSFAFADVDVPPPPQTLKSTEITNANAAETLANKINNLVEKEEHRYTRAKIIEANDKQIILNYEYQYGWRASDNAESTLVYNIIEKDWQLKATLYGRINSKDHIVDLTGDGIAEIILTSVFGFRAQSRVEQRIMMFDGQTKNYVVANINTISEASADCNDQKNISQKLSIQKKSPLPFIIINENIEKVNKKNCNIEPVSNSITKYIWSAKEKKFIPADSGNVVSKVWKWISSW